MLVSFVICTCFLSNLSLSSDSIFHLSPLISIHINFNEDSMEKNPTAYANPMIANWFIMNTCDWYELFKLVWERGITGRIAEFF